MNFLISVALISSLIVTEGRNNAVEFSTLMKELHRGMKGFCFIFEGEMTSLEPNGQIKAGRAPIIFQGLYALRPGPQQAGLLEIFRGAPPSPPNHTSRTILNGILDISSRPSLNDAEIDPNTKKLSQ